MNKDKNTTIQIPKKIHYFWFGNKQKPKIVEKCIMSWKKNCPDYEIIEWNESNFNTSICDYVKEAYEAGRWAFVSDYARIWVIQKYGGIYLDTDVELLSSLDKFLSNKTFFATESNKAIGTGVGFGSTPNNPILSLILKEYNKLHFKLNDGNYDTTPCPIRQTKIIKDYLGDFDINNSPVHIGHTWIYPSEFFCPLDYSTHKLSKTKNTVAIHWYAGSWVSPKQRLAHIINIPVARTARFLKKHLSKEDFNKLRRLFKKQ